MDNNELRLAIAKAKGWKVWLGNYGRDLVLPPDEEADSFPVVDGFNPITTYFRQSAPNWPEDIGAAWEFVEEGKYEGCDIHIETDDDNPGQWKCLFWDLAEAKDNRHRATADTAPRAICLAYLAWKEATK